MGNNMLEKGLDYCHESRNPLKWTIIQACPAIIIAKSYDDKKRRQ